MAVPGAQQRGMQVRLPALSSSASAGRRAVRQYLGEVGRADLSDGVELVATELVANAVLHARTQMWLSAALDGDGVRVAVTDGSSVLPHWSPAPPTSLSGRGLPLVARLSQRWGVEALPGGGKRVWAQVDASSLLSDPRSPEDLVELWSDDAWPDVPAPAGIDVELDIDVQAMLASRAHTDDLLRDLQLTLLSADEAAGSGTAPGGDPVLVRLARRLDDANEQFQDARRQMIDQTVLAARAHHAQTTLHLRLQPIDVVRARRWLEALDEADTLTADGTLLLPPFPPEMTAFRRQYIGTIIDRLSAAA